MYFNLHRFIRFSAVSIFLVLLCLKNVQANEFSLDMRGVDIREFINTVSKLTGKNIVTDKKVRGTVDIQSPRKLTREELYDVFLAQLSVHGYTVVDAGTGVYKVVPLHAAKMEGIGLKEGVVSPGEKIITRVVPVHNVDASQLVSTLQPLVDNKVGTISGYNTSNVILITDRASNVLRLMNIIDKVDKTDPLSLELIQLNNASASEMQRILTDITAVKSKSRKDQSRTQPLISVDNRTNTLIISADDATRRRFRQLVAELDSTIETSNNTRVVYLKYAKAEKLVTVLKSVSDAILQEEKKLNGNKSKNTRLSSINIEGHEATNSLILSGSPHIIRSLEGVIRKLDIRRAQVLVEAIVVEMSDNRARELGVQWLFRGDPSSEGRAVGTINFPNNETGIVNIASAADSNAAIGALPAGVSFGIGHIDNNGFSFAALIQALGTDTDSNVLSTPSLLTMDNEEASILVGREVPIITGSTTSSNNDNPFRTFERRDVGIKLIVTPQINEGDAVALSIEQEVSSLSGISASDIITDKRVVKTKVLVDDGATIILGGLIDEDTQQSTSKVPLLGDIPLLGRAFRSDSSKKVKRNLMIFIRPTIARDRKTIAAVSREKYNYIHARQLLTQEDNINLLPKATLPALPAWPANKESPPSRTSPEIDDFMPVDGR